MTAALPEIGELVENRYRILSALGAGGMGAVYLVADEAIEDRVVALKTLATGATTPMEIESFQHEFRVLTQLRHPNLVGVYEYGSTGRGNLYFTMEYVPGQDPRSYLQGQRASQVTPLIVQVCRALAYLHARGVMHGDLKPSNILVVGDQVKLVDFGLASEFGSRRLLGAVGTLGYIAPEAQQQYPVDYRADLYSLGATWYALLTGEPPHFTVGHERLVKFALEETLAGQEEIPPDLVGVITQLLAWSPIDRPPGANAVIEAINATTGSHYALETRETAASYALQGRFVGRESEMALLRSAWEETQVRADRLVLVSGESGVGKTRLLEEFTVEAQLGSAWVARGQCIETGGGAYQPWREILRVLVRYLEGETPDATQWVQPVLATLLPELWQRPYLQGVEPPPPLDPQGERQRLNEAIARLLRGVANLRSCLVVIEDAQWADEATLELLRFLVRAGDCEGLLTCVTYRDDELDPAHPLERMGGAQVSRVRLSSFSAPVTGQLVRSMLGLERIASMLSERVQEVTGGNSYFVQELIRSLAEEGTVLRRTVNGWQVDAAVLPEVALPGSIRQVVLRRLAQLTPRERKVLQSAAVVGPLFWDGTLLHICNLPQDQVSAALESLQRRGMIARQASAFPTIGAYRFRHTLLQQTAYEAACGAMDAEQRRTSHARVAGWLIESNQERVDEYSGLIGEHLERGGQARLASAYFRQAGEQAAAQFAHAEALAYLSRAIALARSSGADEAGRYALLLARERVYDLQGARAAQQQDLATLRDLAQRLADPRLQAEVALRQANYSELTGDYLTAVAAAQAAVELAGAGQDVERQAAGYLRWGQTLWRQGDREGAQQHLKQALSLAAGAALHQTQAGCLRLLGTLLANQGDYVPAQSFYRQAAQICRDSSDPYGEGAALNNLGNVLLEQGKHDAARVCFTQALHIFQKIGARHGEGIVLTGLGGTLMDQGDYVKAKTCFEQSLDIKRAAGHRQGESLALGNLGLVYAKLGLYDQARVCHEKALDIALETGDRRNESWELFYLGLLAQQVGAYEASEAYSRRALSTAQEIGDRHIQAYALTCLGHALSNLGRLQEASAAYEQALALRRESGQINLALEPAAGLAQVALAAGDLGQALTRVDEIVGHLETRSLEGTQEPARVYLSCYRVLQACQNSRALELLAQVHDLLQGQAARIADPQLQRSFLENVKVHREVMHEIAQARNAV